MPIHTPQTPIVIGAGKNSPIISGSFLMLFLAVFCGFLAENLREHFVEHQREKQYMITLLEYLEIDTATMSKLRSTLREVILRKDSIKTYLKPPIIKKITPSYIKESYAILTLRGFSYNGRTVDQPRSAGNYRLKRNKNVTDSLIQYDKRMRGTFIKSYNVIYESRFILIELQSDIIYFGYEREDFDQNGNPIEDSLKKRNQWPLRLLPDDTKILNHYYNSCLAHIGFNEDLYAWIGAMQSKAENLTVLIKKEYHLN